MYNDPPARLQEQAFASENFACHGEVYLRAVSLQYRRYLFPGDRVHHERLFGTRKGRAQGILLLGERNYSSYDTILVLHEKTRRKIKNRL